jgi:hypothetical protein
MYDKIHLIISPVSIRDSHRIGTTGKTLRVRGLERVRTDPQFAVSVGVQQLVDIDAPDEIALSGSCELNREYIVIPLIGGDMNMELKM